MSVAVTTPARVGLIGVSGYGRIHLDLLEQGQSDGSVLPVAATIINPAEEAEIVARLTASGCRVYHDYREMLAAHAGDIELCMVPTGIDWHSRMTIDALDHGANVLVEKPLCATGAEAHAILAAETRNDRFVAVGFQDIYEPGTDWLKRELGQGVIGQITRVKFFGQWPRPAAYYQRNGWAGRITAGGQTVCDSPLNNAMAHFLMLSLYLAGREPGEAARATLRQAELRRAHAIESFDTGVVQLRSRAGVEFWIGATHLGRGNIDPSIEIFGTEGRAGWHYEDRAWWTRTTGEEAVRELGDAFAARRAMMHRTLARLRDPAVPVCSARMAACHTHVIEQLHRDQLIHAFDDSLVKWLPGPDGGAEVPVVAGLTEALLQAFTQENQLADHGFDSVPLSA